MQSIEVRPVSLNTERGLLIVLGNVFQQIVYFSEEVAEVYRKVSASCPLVVPLSDTFPDSIEQVRRVCAGCPARSSSLELVHLRKRPFIENEGLGTGLLCYPGKGERKCEVGTMYYSDLDEEQRKIISDNVRGEWAVGKKDK